MASTGQGDERREAHWRKNRQILSGLLVVWFVASFVLGIVLVEPLNAFRLGGFPLGFWFAQQGSIYVFVVLIAVYAVWMDRVDARFRDPGSAERSDDDSGGPA